PRAAPLGRDGHAPETELEGLLHRLLRIAVLAIPTLRVGDQLPVGELPAGVPQQPLFFGEFDFHGESRGWRLRDQRVYTGRRPAPRPCFFVSAYLAGFWRKSGLQSGQQKA